MLVRPCALLPREQGRVQVVGLEAPDGPGAVAREQVDDGLVPAPLRQLQRRQTLFRHHLLDEREELAFLEANVLLEQRSQLGCGGAVRQARHERPDAGVLGGGADERLGRRPLFCGEQREDELFLVAEVAADLAGEDAPEPRGGGRQLRIVPVLGGAAQLARADERVVVVVRERHERGVALHEADGMRPRKLGG